MLLSKHLLPGKNKMEKKPHFLLLTKLVKSCFCLSLLRIIHMVYVLFVSITLGPAFIPPLLMLVFIGKTSLLFDKLSCFLLRL